MRHVVAFDNSSLDWRTSSYSGGAGGNCVEVAAAGDLRLIRDSKHADEDALAFQAHEWAAFLASAGRHHL